jgi:hypothetical protein
MSAINQLNQVASLSGGDTIPVYSSSNGDTEKVSLTQLVAYILAQLGSATGSTTQYASPNATGFSVTISNQTFNTFLLLTPATGYAAGTIVLPLKDTAPDQMKVTVTCTQAVTTLTINGNGANVYGAPTSLTANQSFTLQFDGVNKNWYLFN